jgi:hypothetical protein
VPGAHALHEPTPLWPVSALKLPAGHATQAAASLVAPATTPYEPAEQGAHAAWPGAALNVPAAHGVQPLLDVAPVLAPKLPAAHDLQLAAPTVSEYSPWPHGTHASTPALPDCALNVPSGHAAQASTALDLPAATPYVPGAHAWHDDWPGAAL